MTRATGCYLCPASFYILMNSSNTIISTRWNRNEFQELLYHTLSKDSQYYTTKGLLLNKPKFFIFENLLFRCFCSV